MARKARYDKPYPVRLTSELHQALGETARRLRTSQQGVLRVALGLGLNHLNREIVPGDDDDKKGAKE